MVRLPHLLGSCFSVLKQSLVKPEKKQKIIESFKRLCDVLQQETALIAKHGSSMVPEIDFDDIHNNGGELPKRFAELLRDRGCVIFHNVVLEEQASAWEAELKDYTKRHKSVGGFPVDNPQNWSLWWTRPQVQIRSHERVSEAMSASASSGMSQIPPQWLIQALKSPTQTVSASGIHPRRRKSTPSTLISIAGRLNDGKTLRIVPAIEPASMESGRTTTRGLPIIVWMRRRTSTRKERVAPAGEVCRDGCPCLILTLEKVRCGFCQA